MDAGLKQKLIEIEKQRDKIRRMEFIYDIICFFSISFTAAHIVDFVISFF